MYPNFVTSSSMPRTMAVKNRFWMSGNQDADGGALPRAQVARRAIGLVIQTLAARADALFQVGAHPSRPREHAGHRRGRHAGQAATWRMVGALGSSRPLAVAVTGILVRFVGHRGRDRNRLHPSRSIRRSCFTLQQCTCSYTISMALLFATKRRSAGRHGRPPGRLTVFEHSTRQPPDVTVVRPLRGQLAFLAARCAGARQGVGRSTPGRGDHAGRSREQVRGGWAGQMIGVSFGAPTEFKSNGKIIEGDLPPWRPNGLQRHRSGRPVRRDDVCRSDGSDRPRRHHRGLRARRFGQPDTTSGTPTPARGACSRPASRRRGPATRKYNVHANDIDFQIEADFIGLMAPGLPQRRAGLQHPRRPGDEFRRRALRRPVRHRHVRGRVLRDAMSVESSKRDWR